MKSESLLLRSIVAILLLIGFYVLALGIAGGLLWLVYAQIFLAHHVFLKLVLICLALAGMILWSVLPRPDHFEPPGPRLSEAEHPRNRTRNGVKAVLMGARRIARLILDPDPCGARHIKTEKRRSSFDKRNRIDL